MGYHRFYLDFSGFYWDFIGFYLDFSGFYGDLVLSVSFCLGFPWILVYFSLGFGEASERSFLVGWGGVGGWCVFLFWGGV